MQTDMLQIDNLKHVMLQDLISTIWNTFEHFVTLFCFLNVV